MPRTQFTENRLSVDPAEIVLLDRKFDPNMKHVAIMLLVVATFVALGEFSRSGNIAFAGAAALAVWIIGFLSAPWFYYLYSGQAWTSTELLANSTYVRGYLQGFGPWPYALTETSLRLEWKTVRSVTISHRPWIYAEDKRELDIALHDGAQRTFRLPRLIDDEADRLAEVLRAIGGRCRFTVDYPSATEQPRFWPMLR